MSLFRHSGLDPWFDGPFDRLTVLSKVEGLTTVISQCDTRLDTPASRCGINSSSAAWRV